MIDRENRNKLAESCRHYWSCLVDNFEFDEINFKIESDDKAIDAIINSLWYLYDDIRMHKNQGKWKMADSDDVILKRTILFLKSDTEYSWIHPSMMKRIKAYLNKKLRLTPEVETKEKTSEGDEDYWPFFSLEEYKEALNKPKYLIKPAANKD